MTEQVKLIVGLGNPGTKYDQTRHNAGAELVEQLADQLHSPLSPEKRFHGRYSKARLDGHELHLLVPTTFMNLSGQAVQALASYYKIPVESVLVVHDELDIPPGCAKLKKGGGHGGHNGLRDIIQKFGGSNAFLRLRVGIGHPGNAKLVHSFVLGRAPSSERNLTQAATDEALACLPVLLRDGLTKAMTRLHSFKP
ncbi:aminoacyl-tRNA hydrolase [Motiliproteus coralliicola]|uniref:Peptidyl-tRNA hydrolase n=1 Tax=Motiliproteus coralliicola TaxID=2283196 RepID=A0A369W804_9GAMM|nr:aminoacyl-tRNA hydrolase [Motiliproteus coralliicola]RDE18138.1 aminoacyl-tRNA hydrolase [Motiliproteus coralliicola]